MNRFLSAGLCLISLLCSISSPLQAEESSDIRVGSGAQYYRVNADGDSGNTGVTDWMAQLQGQWAFSKRFFVGATGSIPLWNQEQTERYRISSLGIQESELSLDEKNLNVYGGVDVFPLMKPFLGLSASSLKIERSGALSSALSARGDQIVSELSLLLGVRGSYDFSDYTSFGYSLSYQGFPTNTVEYGGVDFEDVDSSKVSSEIFVERWLSNEICQIGFHLYGGRYYFDEQSSANELLPETDIQFVGALLSLKVKV